MIAVDTNVLARLVTDDDPIQVARAMALFEADEVFVAKTVLLELEWVLRFSYSLDRRTIGRVLGTLADTSGVRIEAAESVGDALVAYRRGVDLADALHLASSGGATRFATFDRKLRARAKKLALRPPVVEP